MKTEKYFLILLVPLVLSILSTNLVLADSNPCQLSVSLINQDPYPAVPNEYVNVVFQVSGVQNQNCNGARFELIPSYPFSLDNNDNVRVLNGATYLSDNKNEWMISYKLRVDKDAINENASIEVNYNSGNQKSDFYFMEKFNINIKDSRTTFDAVIQETSSSDVSIAIANTGKYAANSVVVRIPDQDDYIVSGTNGQMIGNLNSGDYTIVSFSLSPKMQTNFQNASRGNVSRTNFGNMSSQTLQNNLKFDVYYTDNLGERRIVNMELPLNLAVTGIGNFSLTGRSFSGRTSTSSSSLLAKWYFWAIIAFAVLILYGFYNKYRRKIKSVFAKKENNSDTPEWVKNAKEKEKRK